MPHDYPIPEEYFDMHQKEKRKAEIAAQIEAMAPEDIEKFLEGACERYLEPGLSDEVFQAFVAKCTPKALDILRERLQRRGSAAGVARLEQMIAALEGG